MPLTLAYMPHGEENVRGRILAKWRAYWEVWRDITDNGKNLPAEGPKTMLDGERYEIVCAIHNYRLGRHTRGEQITRWGTDFDKSCNIDVKKLQISMGTNTELDFVIPASANFAGCPAVNGAILGDAKDIRGSPGKDIRELLAYVLNEDLGGFCYLTPQPTVRLYNTLMFTTHRVLTGKEEVLPYAGGNAWRHNKQGAIAYFKNRYGHISNANQYWNAPLQRMTANDYVKELAQQAGFVVLCDQVSPMDHNQLRAELEGKEF